MKSPKKHTIPLFHCLAVLCGVFLFSLLPIEIDHTEFSLLQFSEVENHFDSAIETEGEEPTKIPAASGTDSEIILKEAPKQEQSIVASHNPLVLNKGSNPPEPDSKDISKKRSILFKALMLFPEKYQSNDFFRLTIHLLSYFFSLPGDIAINAP